MMFLVTARMRCFELLLTNSICFENGGSLRTILILHHVEMHMMMMQVNCRDHRQQAAKKNANYDTVCLRILIGY